MKASLKKVINMEKESTTILKVNFIQETGKIMLSKAWVNIFMRMEPDTTVNF